MISRLAFALSLLIGFLPPVAQATDTPFLPAADAFVDSAKPGNNYGQAGALGVSAVGAAKGEFDSFLRFDLSPLGAGAVQAISLQLNSTPAMNALFNPNAAGSFTIAWTSNDAFVEGSGTPSVNDTNAADVDFNNHSSYLTGLETLGTFTYDGSTGLQSPYSLALTPGFLADVQARGKVTLYLAPVPGDANVSYLFSSVNFTGPNSAKPTLTVTTAPEPGAASLLAGGAGLLALRRRRAHV